MIGEQIFIDKKGNRQFAGLHFDNATPFRGGLAVVQLRGDRHLSYIDTHGKVVAPAESTAYAYGPLEPVREELVRSGQGYVDMHGRLAIEKKDWTMWRSFREGLAWVLYTPCCGLGRWGAMDTHGQWVIPPTYHGEPSAFYEGMATVAERQGLIGYIDKTGALRIPCQYSEARRFINGHAMVRLPGRPRDEVLVIDKTGAVVRPYTGPYFGDLSNVREDGMYEFQDPDRQRAGRCGLLDAEGNIVMPPVLYCGRIGLFVDGLDSLAWATTGQVEGFVNRNADFAIVAERSRF